MTNVIVNPKPLRPSYLPDPLVNRESEQSTIETALSFGEDVKARNLVLHGDRGTGKTVVLHTVLRELPSVNVCYVPCTQYNTTYKVLQQLHHAVVGDEIGDGYHTAELQDRIEARLTQTETVVVLDDVDFLLSNDGNDLLYFLSRIETNSLYTICLTANYEYVSTQLADRTASSLQPYEIFFGPYSQQQLYLILRDRAHDALAPGSIRRTELGMIASDTPNAALALQWLKTAAESTDYLLTEGVIRETQQAAYEAYADGLLRPFTDHHRLLYQAIVELTAEQAQSYHTGEIYERYRELCGVYGEEPRTIRRISDFLTQLELLTLVDADYHYGGSKGKTREIRLEGHDMED